MYIGMVHNNLKKQIYVIINLACHSTYCIFLGHSVMSYKHSCVGSVTIGRENICWYTEKGYVNPKKFELFRGMKKVFISINVLTLPSTYVFENLKFIKNSAEDY